MRDVSEALLGGRRKFSDYVPNSFYPRLTLVCKVSKDTKYWSILDRIATRSQIWDLILLYVNYKNQKITRCEFYAFQKYWVGELRRRQYQLAQYSREILKRQSGLSKQCVP